MLDGFARRDAIQRTIDAAYHPGRRHAGPSPSAARSHARSAGNRKSAESTSRRSVIQATDSARSGWTAKKSAATVAAISSAIGRARASSGCARARRRRARPAKSTASIACSTRFVRCHAAASIP
jgi:hypothetical protein